MRAPSKAAALRWFAARVGREVDTVQTRPTGLTWEPGLRTVAAYQRDAVKLDGSTVRFTPNIVVHAVTDTQVSIECLDSDGVRIYATVYSDPPGQEDEQ